MRYQGISLHSETDATPLPRHTSVTLDLDLLRQSDHVTVARGTGGLVKLRSDTSTGTLSVISLRCAPSKTCDRALGETSIDGSRVRVERATSHLCAIRAVRPAHHRVAFLLGRDVEDPLFAHPTRLFSPIRRSGGSAVFSGWCPLFVACLAGLPAPSDVARHFRA